MSPSRAQGHTVWHTLRVAGSHNRACRASDRGPMKPSRPTLYSPTFGESSFAGIVSIEKLSCCRWARNRNPLQNPSPPVASLATLVEVREKTPLAVYGKDAGGLAIGNPQPELVETRIPPETLRDLTHAPPTTTLTPGRKLGTRKAEKKGNV